MAGFILLAASTKKDHSSYWRLWSLEAQFTKTTTTFVLKGTLHVVMDLCCFDQASSKKQLILLYSLNKFTSHKGLLSLYGATRFLQFWKPRASSILECIRHNIHS